MKRIIHAIALMLISAVALGQDYPSPAHQQTSANPGARFEVLQSPLAAKWTFRLDRFTGRVSQLVRTSDESNKWEDMLVVEPLKVQSGTRARFQLFTSGLAARHTFLVDTDSGKTWTLTTGKAKNRDGSEYEYYAWEPFSN